MPQELNYNDYLLLSVVSETEINFVSSCIIYEHDEISHFSQSNGYMENDIVDGILIQTTETFTVSQNEYLIFLEKLNNINKITEEALLELLPVTMNGNYGDPF